MRIRLDMSAWAQRLSPARRAPRSAPHLGACVSDTDRTLILRMACPTAPARVATAGIWLEYGARAEAADGLEPKAFCRVGNASETSAEGRKYRFAGTLKRLMGLEPTTFCMASSCRSAASDCFLPANRSFRLTEGIAGVSGIRRVSTEFCHPIVTGARTRPMAPTLFHVLVPPKAVVMRPGVGCTPRIRSETAGALRGSSRGG
jgi:hypothetical protein